MASKSGAVRMVNTGFSCDANDCSAFAAKFPQCGVKVAKHDDRKTKVRNRDAAVKCVDFLVKYVDRAPEVWSSIEQMKKEEAVSVDDDGKRQGPI